MRWIAALSLFAVLGSACGDDDDLRDDTQQPAVDAAVPQPDSGTAAPDAMPMGRVETRSYTFGNGNLVEGTLALTEGDRFVWTIASAGGDAFYNVHAHANGETTTYVEDQGTTVEYEFSAQHTGDFYFLLGNTSAPDTISVDISFELFGSAQVTDWGD